MLLVKGKAGFPPGRAGSVEIHPKTAYSEAATNLSFGFAALRSNTEK
jgi:hypothetical protein